MTPDTSGSQTHHREVAQPNPSDTRAYLEQLTKAVFIAGLNWKVVENKWPGFLEAFHGFDPRYVRYRCAVASAAIQASARPLSIGTRIESDEHAHSIDPATVQARGRWGNSSEVEARPAAADSRRASLGLYVAFLPHLSN